MCIFISTWAQNDPAPLDRINIGAGFGLDYGGAGANFTIYPVKNVGLFAGAGYAFAGVSYNLGVKARLFAPAKAPKLQPSFIGMYGYNAAIMVSNSKDLNKLFYGPTIGAGLDLRLRKETKGYLSLGLFLPIRKGEVRDYLDYLEEERNVDITLRLIPIAFSVGYRYILR